MNIYIVLANITAAVHGMVCVYLFSLLIFSFKKSGINRWYYMPAVPMILVQMYYALTQGSCPLTIWENHFRELGEQSAYLGGYVAHYSKLYCHKAIPETVISLFIGIISAVILLHFFSKSLRSKKKLVHQL